MSRFWIEYLKGERAGDVGEYAGDVVSVGRSSSECKLKFDERGVSWEHAEFRLRDDAWWVIDLGSTNGTYVNDERAQNVKLSDGDIVKFGKKGPVLRFRLKDPAEEPAPKPKVKVREREPDAASGSARGPHMDLGRSDLPAASGRVDVGGRSRAAVILVLGILLCASFAISGVLYLHSQTLESKLTRANQGKSDAEEDLHQVRLEIDSRLEEARKEGQQHSATLVDQLKGDLTRADREAREREQRHGEQVERLEASLSEVRGLLAKALSNQSAGNSESEHWQKIERRVTPSVVFVATYLIGKTEDGKEIPLHSFGTGFFVSRQGHIVTNKHVIQPWKFRPLAERMVKEGITIDEERYQVHVWVAGSRFARDAQPGHLTFDLSTGFSTANNSLEIIRTAPDKWRNAKLSSPSPVREYRFHEGATNLDLALLQAKGRRTFQPVATGDSNRVRKLQEIMVLGFPAGPTILEAGVAETSPARGQVRKVEDTILVAAPMIGGNSGGPLIDRQGRVIGISTRAQRGSETLGSCLRIEHALELLNGGPW
jgi:pSer/pThr/pTyr-binding forkhead associated (FHA) protein